MKSLFDNLALKIVALLLGLLLWFHVATEKVYTYQVRLPLNIINLGQDLALVRYPVDSLTVVVSASGKRLGRTRWRSDGVRINALQFPAGRHQVTLTPANTTLIGGSNLISLDEVVTPTSVELYVDRKSEVSLRVEADLVAVADDGFAVASISKPQPDQVKVVGPRSLLGGFSIVFTEHKKMTGLRNSLEIILPLALPAGHGISLDPDSVTLSIEVVPVRTRVFEGVPIVLYNLPPDSRASSRPGRITVILTGPPDAIDSLDASALIASANFASMDSSGRVAVKVDCPALFRVKSVSVDSVTIRGGSSIMKPYRNLGDDSGIKEYGIGTDFIVVLFGDGWKYTFTYASADSGNVEHMKRLAQNGRGLNTFINTNVRKRYATKSR